MASYSHNGWTVIEEASTKVWRIPVKGDLRHLRLRKGDAGFVLAWLALWFHENIEPLNQGQWDEWGYAKRKIGATTLWSNHASGTACDLNATKHPQGVRGTFSAFKQRRIRRVMRRRFDRLVRWGGDYVQTPDDMHFEIVGNGTQIDRLARRLRDTRRGKRLIRAN